MVEETQIRGAQERNGEKVEALESTLKATTPQKNKHDPKIQPGRMGHRSEKTKTVKRKRMQNITLKTTQVARHGRQRRSNMHISGGLKEETRRVKGYSKTERERIISASGMEVTRKKKKVQYKGNKTGWASHFSTVICNS